MMGPLVRQMQSSETELIIDYFLSARDEHLALLGVDRRRLPARETWRQHFARDEGLPLAERRNLYLVWLLDDRPVGFSTADKIVFGERANMHLHILDADRRRIGLGSECVRQSAALYFETLKLKELFCEPNAFNVAPNRALQKAGFTYVMTHMTTPGPLNHHQAVTRWVLRPSA